MHGRDRSEFTLVGRAIGRVRARWPQPGVHYRTCRLPGRASSLIAESCSSAEMAEPAHACSEHSVLDRHIAARPAIGPVLVTLPAHEPVHLLTGSDGRPVPGLGPGAGYVAIEFVALPACERTRQPAAQESPSQLASELLPVVSATGVSWLVSSYARRRSCRSTSGGCAPLTAYLPSATKNGTPVMPYRAACCSSLAPRRRRRPRRGRPVPARLAGRPRWPRAPGWACRRSGDLR
jgi:hypothetical protein